MTQSHANRTIDVMLALLPDPTAKRREIYRLHEWLLEHDMTAIITASAVRELRLTRGDAAAALIKSTDVMIERLDD